MNNDLISKAELFNKLAVIKAPPEANEYKGEVYSIIQAMETADAVEVVRCRNCVNYKSGVSIFGTCKRFNTNTLINGYCSYGERSK